MAKRKINQPCIAIAMPLRDMLHPDTHRSIQNLRMPRPFHTLDVRDRPVDHARNEIVGRAFNVNDAVKNGADMPAITHILWVDDDMAFPPDALERLLAHDAPIVGGLCHNRRPPYMPILLYKSVGLTGRGYSYRYDYPPGMVEVDATGAAFILVKMEVYEAIEKKFPRAGEGPYTNRGSGEDVSFCERAKECGYKIFVDTTIDVTHIGELHINADTARKYRNGERSVWIPPVDGNVAEGAPWATILVPTHNEPPKVIGAAVRSALVQTAPVEVIILDDASKEPVTPKLLGLESLTLPNLRILRNETNLGLWTTLNRGMKEATAEYIAFLSADDLYYPKKIEHQVQYMRAYGARVSYHSYDTHSADGYALCIPAIPWRSHEEQKRTMPQGCVVNMLTMLIHREVIEEMGGFDTSFKVSSDWDFECRIGLKHLWHAISEPLTMRCVHEGNASLRYAKDPIMRVTWAVEDQRIRDRYAPRCTHCGVPL